MATIYEQAKQRLKSDEIGHHESDLYLKVNSISEELVSNYEFKKSVKKFVSLIDNELWFDLPFAYDPYFDKIK